MAIKARVRQNLRIAIATKRNQVIRFLSCPNRGKLVSGDKAVTNFVIPDLLQLGLFGYHHHDHTIFVAMWAAIRCYFTVRNFETVQAFRAYVGYGCDLWDVSSELSGSGFDYCEHFDFPFSPVNSGVTSDKLSRCCGTSFCRDTIRFVLWRLIFGQRLDGQCSFRETIRLRIFLGKKMRTRM